MAAKTKIEKEIEFRVEPFTPVEMEQYHRMWRKIFEELNKIEAGSR